MNGLFKITPRILLFSICLSFSVHANESALIEAAKVGAADGRNTFKASVPNITVKDLKSTVSLLTSEKYSGRLTGEAGEIMATNFVAEFFQQLGLQPAGDENTFFDKFPYRSKMVLSGSNSLTVIESEEDDLIFEAGDSYQPLPFSPSERVDSEIVFAGFGIDDEDQDYNSFKGLDVKGKWVLVLRGSPKSKPKLKSHAPLYKKTFVAKEKGAVGIIFIKAQNPNVGSELISPSNSRSSSKPLLPALTITDKLAETLFNRSDQKKKRKLKGIFNSYNNGKRVKGFYLNREIIAEINLKSQNDPGTNVLGRLVVGDRPSKKVVILGGHVDHLGRGDQGGSRSTGAMATALHPGADDNASGISVIMEVAQQLVAEKKAGKLKLKHDIVFAAWSGEELGLWGSRHFVKEHRAIYNKAIYPNIVTYLNLDMVGRLTDSGLRLTGVDSSYDFRSLLSNIPAIDGLEIDQIDTPYVPSDSEPFYFAGVPILSASTGLHDDYHTPEDTLDKINFPGLLKIAEYTKRLVSEVAKNSEPPSFVQVPRQLSKQRSEMRKRLGIRVEPADEDGSGVKIAEVFKASKAEAAGLKRGDIVIRLNNEKPSSIEDFYAVGSKLDSGGEYSYTIERNGKSINKSFSMGDRLVPFSEFSFNVDLSDPEGLVELTMYMSRDGSNPNGEVALGARCLQFPAGQRMISDEELALLAKACRFARNSQSFEELIETPTYRGVSDTYYRSVKKENKWVVTIDRADISLELNREESDHLADAYQQSQAAISWYTSLLADQEVAQSKLKRPPVSVSYSLDAEVGEVMSENKEIGFKVNVDNLNEEKQLQLSFSLMLGLSASRGSWVEELYEEIGKALKVVESGGEYKAKEVGDAKVSVDAEKNVVDVAVRVLNRDDRTCSYSRDDYRQLESLVDKSRRWLNWAIENESWFHTKP